MRNLMRRLLGSPAFALAVICTVAVAVGANTLVFSVVNGVLLRPLPFRNPGRLVAVVNSGAQRPGNGISPLDFIDWREQVHAFDGFAGWQTSSLILLGETQSVGVTAASVSANWFDVLGIPIALGRGFAPDEDQDGSDNRVVVLSDGLWRDQFGANPRVIGTTIELDNQRYSVIGVAAPGYASLPSPVDLWRPFVITPAMRVSNARGSRYIQLAVGRLRAGVSLLQSRADVQAVAERLHRQYPDEETGLRYDIEPLRAHLVASAKPVLLVLFAAVGAILLIACANVANLILVRTAGRAAEIGVRVALGAERARIARDIVGESVFFAVVGSALGFLVALVGLHALGSAHIGDVPRLDEVAIDGRVVGFTIIVAVLTGALAGLGPALRASSANAIRIVTSAARGATAQKSVRRARSAFIVGELALAVPLLVSAGLFGRSLGRLLSVNPGFNADHVVRFDLTVPDTTAVRLRAFTDDLMQRLEAMPGVEAAGAGFSVPFPGRKTMSGFHVVGHPQDPHDQPSLADLNMVTPSYFTVLGVPLIHGRLFTPEDMVGGPGVVVVNQTLAATYFKNEDPIGRTLTDISVNGLSPAGNKSIVGVVGDTKSSDLSAPSTPAIYLPYDQAPVPFLTVALRSPEGPNALLRSARRVVAALDPTVPVSHGTTLDRSVRASAERPRLEVSLVGAFAGIALFLAVVGVYGLVAYTVGVRRREIGIRIALGARRDQVLASVLMQGLRLTALGLVLGIATALVVGRWIRSLLYGVGTTDVVTYATVIGTLIAVSLFASWIPARRAAMTDAVIAMRPE